MGKIQDLTGQTFGFLLVSEFAEIKNHHAYWRCRCLRCGNECIVEGGHLKSGKSQSCGCLRDEKIARINFLHGMCRSKIYANWNTMLQRCYNPKHKRYPDYGGRGIKVCPRWHDFNNFYNDVSTLEHFGEPGYTLDRENVNGNYEPGNVRWATNKQQCNNKRNNVKVMYNGEEMTLAQAAEKSGIKYGTLLRRYSTQGLRGDELFRSVER